MKTAFFSILPAWGHLNPNIKLARYLQKSGYRCVFASTPEFREVIIKNGFELVLIQSKPFGLGLEDMQDENINRPYLESLLDRFQDLSYNSRKKDYEKWLKEYEPDFILLDAFHSTDFIIFEPLIRNTKSKVVFIQTMFSPYNDGFTPPLNTFLQPNNEQKVKLSWQKVRVKSFFRRTKDFFRFFGLSNAMLVRRKFEQNQIPKKYKIDFNKIFHIGFHNAEEWVLAPQEFEFMGKPKKSNQHYLGLMIDTQEQTLPDNLQDFVNQAKSQHKKTVYASLGTLHNVHTKGKSAQFFEKLLSIFETKENYYLILSVGKELKNTLKTQAKQIKILETVPQRGLLKEVDIFITHGGLNSVLESAYAGTPMLVVPLNNKWDQSGNASRVAYHGLGIKVNLQDNKKTLENTINELLNNAIYQQKAQAFSKALHEKYNNESFLEDFFSTELLIQ
jgi:zeaxanthin glucosyltransferase